MSTDQHIRDVVGEAASRIGAPIDEAGNEFVLSFDGIYECIFSIVEGTDAVDFSTPLCLVGANRTTLFERALRLNLHGAATRGGAISLCADRSVLSLRIRLTATVLDAEWLALTLTDLVDTARTIRRELGDAGVASATVLPHDFNASIAMIRA